MRIAFLFLAACCVAGAQSGKPAVAPKPKVTHPASTTKPAAAKPASKPVADDGKNGSPAPAASATIEPAAKAEPKPKSETLHFTVNWPSGLSLGEGEMTATQSGDAWSFTFKAEAAIPGFAIAESGQAKASSKFCSLEFTKQSTRGKRRTGEQIVFEPSELRATRTTLEPKDGGKSELKTSACARDALTFLYFVRRELAVGKLPQAQPVFYGGPYQTRVQFIGTQQVRQGNEMVGADRLVAHVKGPASEFSVEMVIARDENRTPLLMIVPVAMGKFTVEFSR